MMTPAASRRRMNPRSLSSKHLRLVDSHTAQLCLSLSLILLVIFCCLDVDASPSKQLYHHRLIVQPASGCKVIGKCCRSKDSSCFTTGPRMGMKLNATKAYPTDLKCYCDETCRLTRDCCADYADYCSPHDCVVSDWSDWSPCSVECGSGTSERTRSSVEEARNGGKVCPPLLQKRVCMGTTCIAARSILSKTFRETAKVLPAAFAAWRRYKLYDARQDIRRNLFAKEDVKNESPDSDLLVLNKNGSISPAPKSSKRQNAASRQGYCGRYRIVSVSHGCKMIPWVVSMMPIGGVVCSECQPEAMKANLGGNVCQGHGEVGRATRFTTPIKNYCHGTWQLLSDMTDNCPCMANSTLIFV